MISGYLTYQAGLARIDDLRWQADERRRATPMTPELTAARTTVQHGQRPQPRRSPMGHALGVLRGRRTARA